ncbi:MAG: hypothetical protein WBF17_00195 [Phycisphaerae bacterium]
MAEATYPSEFEQRVLAIEAPGRAPMRANLVAPTITVPGEPFAVKVALADEAGYPSVELDGAITVRGDFASPPAVEVAFRKGRPAVAAASGVTIAAEGLFRFEAELNGHVFHSNPTRCRAGGRARIYWGDPHVHTVLSDCHPDLCRSALFCFTAARHFAGLDWACAADHVSNGRCELARWKESAAVSDACNDPPAFVTLPGYEASFKGGCGGDNNVYMIRWPSIFVEDYESGSVRTVCRKLAEELAPGEEFFVVPHHTTRTGKHGEIPDDIYPGEELMPVVEVHSKWGTSEYRGNPNPLCEVHPGPSYAVDLLNRGLRMGFVGGTDTHSTMPAGLGHEHLDRPPGMTAVLTEELTRPAIYHGIRRRNCYAASIERIYLDVTVAGAAMGRSLSWPDAAAERAIEAAAAGRSDIERIDVVRNGETIHSHAVGGWAGGVSFTDADDLSGLWLESEYLGRFAYYYVRVTCASGAQAWSSPVWLIG